MSAGSLLIIVADSPHSARTIFELGDLLRPYIERRFITVKVTQPSRDGRGRRPVEPKPVYARTSPYRAPDGMLCVDYLFALIRGLNGVGIDREQIEDKACVEQYQFKPETVHARLGDLIHHRLIDYMRDGASGATRYREATNDDGNTIRIPWFVVTEKGKRHSGPIPMRESDRARHRRKRKNTVHREAR